MNSKLRNNGYKCPPSLKCSPWTLILQLLCCQLIFDNRKFSFLFCWSSTKRWQNDTKWKGRNGITAGCLLWNLDDLKSYDLSQLVKKNQDLGAWLSKAHHLFPLYLILLSLKPPSVLQLFFYPLFEVDKPNWPFHMKYSQTNAGTERNRSRAQRTTLEGDRRSSECDWRPTRLRIESR